MEPAHIIRAARRARGLSQRQLADRVGMAHSTVAKLEAGHVQPRWETVTKLLAALGLEPALGQLAPPADEELRAWLRLPTTERLYRSLGGLFIGYSDRRLPVWSALVDAVRSGTAALAPEASVGVWLPGQTVTLPLDLLALPPRYGVRPWPASSELLRIRRGPWRTVGLVPVGVGPRHDVLVLPPDSPLWQTDATTAARLRAAAGLLHGEMRRDEAGRRKAAHRDSDPVREFGWVETRHRFDPTKERPDPRRRRDWRLGGESSLRQWLGVRGHDTSF